MLPLLKTGLGYHRHCKKLPREHSSRPFAACRPFRLDFSHLDSVEKFDSSFHP